MINSIKRTVLTLSVLLLPFCSFAQKSDPGPEIKTSRHQLIFAAGPTFMNEHEMPGTYLEAGHAYQLLSFIAIQNSIGIYSAIKSARSRFPANGYGYGLITKMNLKLWPSKRFWMEASGGGGFFLIYDMMPSSTMQFIEVYPNGSVKQKIKATTATDRGIGQYVDYSMIAGLNLVYRIRERSEIVIALEQAFPGPVHSYMISKAMLTFRYRLVKKIK